jgi:hypothetical protein
MAQIPKKYNNNYNHHNHTIEKNLWCRDIYWEIVQEELGFNPFREYKRYCSRTPETCRGAHSIKEIRQFKHLSQFDRLNKSTFDWIEFFNNIKECLHRDGKIIKNHEHIAIISNIENMNFFQVINVWRDMATFYRKFAKDTPSRSIVKGLAVNYDGFSCSEDIPQFKLSSDIDEVAWSLSRTTRFCQSHLNFKQAISERQKTSIWDVCIATGMNCKEGIHEFNEKLCEQDFLTGTCSCPSIESFRKQQQLLQSKLDVAYKKLSEHQSKEKVMFEDGFVQVKPKKDKTDAKAKLTFDYKRANRMLQQHNLSRMIHYTEFGFVPFEKQYSDWIEANKIAEANKTIVTDDTVVRDDCVIQSKPIKKIVKFGKK